MIKADIVERVREAVGCSKGEAEESVNTVVDLIMEALERGEDVKIWGFGNFAIRAKKARAGRNPRTGEKFEISARRVVSFKPGQVLRATLNADADASTQVEAGGVSRLWK